MSTCRRSTSNNQFCQELQAPLRCAARSHGLARRLLSRRQCARRSSTSGCPPPHPPGFTALTFGDVDTETYALFGDFTYDFTDSSASRSAAATPGTSGLADISASLHLGGARRLGPLRRHRHPVGRKSDFTGTRDSRRSSRRAPRSASTRPRTRRSTPAIRPASKAAASTRAASRPRAATRTAASATPTSCSSSCRSIRRRSTATSSAIALAVRPPRQPRAGGLPCRL